MTPDTSMCFDQPSAPVRHRLRRLAQACVAQDEAATRAEFILLIATEPQAPKHYHIVKHLVEDPAFRYLRCHPRLLFDCVGIHPRQLGELHTHNRIQSLLHNIENHADDHS